MEKKPHLMAIVLFLTGLICIGLLFGLSYKTYQKIDAVAAMMDAYIAWKLNREAFEQIKRTFGRLRRSDEGKVP